MRSKDLFMAATIDPEHRIIMVSGGIDQNEATIVLRISVPEPGTWTIIKAEVNLTNEAWTAWQIGLGEKIYIPSDPSQRLLLSRQFSKCKFMPERNAIMFHGGEVRPSDAIFKIARLEVETPDLSLSHSRLVEDDPEAIERAVRNGFGDDYPKIEVIAPVRITTSDILVPARL